MPEVQRARHMVNAIRFGVEGNDSCIMLQRNYRKRNHIADYKTFEQYIKALQDEDLAYLPVACTDGFHQSNH